ncbi:MAG TPA: hypothetical protein VN894_06875 [Polyangiaceae bacterium]|nr:hypothetical protein [Polyangiaceae bacterium]
MTFSSAAGAAEGAGGGVGAECAGAADALGGGAADVVSVDTGSGAGGSVSAVHAERVAASVTPNATDEASADPAW